MKRRHTIQYTVRALPKDLDLRLKRRAKEKGQSLNEVVLDALKRDAGLSDEPATYSDLDHLIGTWEDDPETLNALANQDWIDEDLWK
jgi:hypothetical protein